MTADFQSIRSAYEKAGQGQVFKFYDDLNDSEKQDFLEQLESIDPERVNKIYTQSIEASQKSTTDQKLEPPHADSLYSTLDSQVSSSVSIWSTLGLEAIRKGQVGVLLLAGGQGTRLGSSDPKGCYDIGLPSKKSLFELQAEKIARLQALAGGSSVLPWYVMTSGPTRKSTESYFRSMKFFWTR